VKGWWWCRFIHEVMAGHISWMAEVVSFSRHAEEGEGEAVGCGLGGVGGHAIIL
jgi:hypothetical protein